MSEAFLLTPDEVCAMLGIGRSHLWTMLKRGEIQSIKIGKLRRIPRVALEEWLKECLDASPPRRDVQTQPQAEAVTETPAPQTPPRRRKRQAAAD